MTGAPVKPDAMWNMMNQLKLRIINMLKLAMVKDDKKRENVSCLVVHEPIGGEWGRKSKVKRVCRCYINDPEQRDSILKKLGRYIERE